MQSSERIQKIVCPTHVHGCHWGLLYNDTVREIPYYDDDGLIIASPRNKFTLASKIVQALRMLKVNVAMKPWDGPLFNMRRLGMPQQPILGDGSSSCGIGVIFSIGDIISSSGNVQFTWSFNESSDLRKITMNELLELRESLK